MNLPGKSQKAVVRGGAAAMLSLFLAACGSDSATTAIDSDDTGSAGVALSGVVYAPGGQLAQADRGPLERVLAFIWGRPAQAALDGLAGVAGVPVAVYEVDANGDPVGEALSTGTTGPSGEFALEAPSLSGRYVVRAGEGAATLESRIDGTTMDVDPVSDAVSRLIPQWVGSAAGLDRLDPGEIRVLESEVEGLAEEVDSDLGSADARTLADTLKTAAEEDAETLNLVQSAAAAGEICGTVTDAAGNGLEGILIVARDYGDWVTRAKTRTAADGSYCLNFPVAGETDPVGRTLSGEYILGAVNLSCAEGATWASEWWSAAGDTHNIFQAEKITVGDTSITRDFQLADGLRIQGQVRAEDTGSGLKKVKIIVRDYLSFTPVAGTRSDANGDYCANVAADGRYLVEAQNRTRAPYASEIYDGDTGTALRNLARPVSGDAGSVQTIDFPLAAGARLAGTVTDGDGTPVPGMRVLVNDAGAVVRLRTNKLGRYRIWLRPGAYSVMARGQTASADLTAGDQVLDFSAAVSRVGGRLLGADGNPVVQAKVLLLDAAGNLVGVDVSQSDGSFVAYTDQTGDHTVQIRVDLPSNGASSVYDGKMTLADGDPVTIAAVGSDQTLPDITLPAPGYLALQLTDANGDPLANQGFQVRYGGTSSAYVFQRHRTHGDGGYLLALPEATYDRLRLGALGVNCDGIPIQADMTTPVTYDGSTCTVGQPQ